MDASSGAGAPDDPDATRQYLDRIRALHREWDELEERGDNSVQLTGRARAALSDAVRADARHGARVQMPPTDAGTYTLTELALRTLIRDSVDEVGGVMCLRTAVDYRPDGERGTRGTPQRVRCRISVSAASRDLLGRADAARASVRAACARDLDLPDLVVDIHIEDLHDD